MRNNMLEVRATRTFSPVFWACLARTSKALAKVMSMNRRLSNLINSFSVAAEVANLLR